ncbi:MAG: hypothetical protein HW421_2560 [Ignavibacteria bacterium]|nr:hypothetical protein [Ignavibacteria bacterium]
MNCREFAEEFYGKTILAFVTSDTAASVFRFRAESIFTFLKKYVGVQFPDWKIIYLYQLTDSYSEDDDTSTIFKNKAEFMYLVAKKIYQTEKLCVFKYVVIPPDMKNLTGKKLRIISLSPKMTF